MLIIAVVSTRVGWFSKVVDSLICDCIFILFSLSSAWIVKNVSWFITLNDLILDKYGGTRLFRVLQAMFIFLGSFLQEINLLCGN